MAQVSSPKKCSPFFRLALAAALVLSLATLLRAQSGPTSASPTSATPVIESTSGNVPAAEALQERITRARALIAAHRLETAASELESVRAANRDNAVRNITSIMLMGVYLEEGNYGRAEALLEETYQARTAQKDESLGTYFALAGQAVNGARTHLARYRVLGISTGDASLPAEAVSDLDRLRSFLERMIAQAKDISSGRKTYDSLSLLEDVLGIRLSLASDAEDQVKWETEYANARELLASSQTQIASLGSIPPLRPGQPSLNKISSASPYAAKKTTETPWVIKAPEKKDSVTSVPSEPASQAATRSTSPANSSSASGEGPPQASAEPTTTDAGSLNAKATKRVVPRYPSMAKQNGQVGLVRVHVIIDETGKVIAVSRSEGPMLLRSAAEEAARQWAFEGLSSDNRPARFTGYIDFNFTL